MNVTICPLRLAKYRHHVIEFIALIEEANRRNKHPLHTYEPDDSEDRNQLSFHKSTAPIRIIQGGNQCTSLDTPISSSRGLVPAADVQVGDEVSGGRVVERWVSPKPVPAYKIDCEGGFQLVGNSEHPVMTESGWRNLKEVQEGEKVELLLGSHVWSESAMTLDDGYFAGLMIGDGCLTHHDGVMSFSSADEPLKEWVRDYVGCLTDVHEESPKELRWCSAALKEKVEHLWGCKIHTARTKSIPREVFKSQEVARQFLRGYTDTDGCVYTDRRPKERQVIWISASRRLLSEMQQLLLAFGVYSSLTRKDKDLGGKTFEQWRLRARGPSADVYMENIGCGLERKSEGYQPIERERESSRWIKVRRKSYCHDKYVIGFTVDPTNEYSTAGIRSHNSGKSRAVAQEIAWILDGVHPHQKTEKNPKVYVISAENRTIQEGIWTHLKTVLPRWKIERMGPRIPRFDFPSYIDYRGNAGKGKVEFITAEGGERARRKLQAASTITDVFVDEEVDQGLWEEIQVRRLGRAARVVISATLVRSDPWLLELEDRALTGDPNIFLVRLRTEAAARAGHISKSVYKELKATFHEEEAEVRLEGKSRRSQGLVYGEFSDLHVCDPFIVPKEWTRYMAIDPGFRTAGVLWAAVSPEEKVYLYRELYLHGLNAYEVGEQIFLAEGWKQTHKGNWIPDEHTEQISCRWMDPSSFTHTESGELKTGMILSQIGLPCSPANHDVHFGINLVKRSLMAGMDGTPQLRVFRTLRSFFREVRNYRWMRDTRDAQQNERPDKPVKRQDHLMDALRYMTASGGGLRFEKKPDSYLAALKKADNYTFEVPPFRSTTKTEDRLRRQWQKMMHRQRHGRRDGDGYGLGCEA